MAKQTFNEMDKKHDAKIMKALEKKSGKVAASKFEAEDDKEDKKLYEKAKKSGKSDAQIMKMDEKKDKKLVQKYTTKSKK